MRPLLGYPDFRELTVHIVIQCASSKDITAPPLRTRDGRAVHIVAHPELVSDAGERVWARPDDPSNTPGASWRELVDRNAADGNPMGLRRTCDLYTPNCYGLLARIFGVARMYVLSAGWGLIRGDFPLPPYDITFVRSANAHKRRLPSDDFRDFSQLRDDGAPVVFLGGRDYLPFFFDLTRAVMAEKIIPFRAPDDAPPEPRREGGVTWLPYRTRRSTNWHYSCANHICREPAWLTSSTRAVTL